MKNVKDIDLDKLENSSESESEDEKRKEDSPKKRNKRDIENEKSERERNLEISEQIPDDFEIPILMDHSDRIQYWNYRKHQIATEFKERDAFVRTPTQMSIFLENKTGGKEDDKVFFPEISGFMSCIPDLNPIQNTKKEFFSLESAEISLKKYIADVALSSGFEAVEENALETLVDLCTEQIWNICEILRRNFDGKNEGKIQNSIKDLDIFGKRNNPMDTLKNITRKFFSNVFNRTLTPLRMENKISEDEENSQNGNVLISQVPEKEPKLATVPTNPAIQVVNTPAMRPQTNLTNTNKRKRRSEAPTKAKRAKNP
eukprot:TRINITY_DN8248_c0_g1_i1.p1 TRINITY_DN8248_c0_g1~~TRINITY_DN8248_c0_g1_i1.p1  ORF type:complete len:361 (-),score=79.16 TRINITY_DN8248_c0_g1_i1:25-969(-)